MTYSPRRRSVEIEFPPDAAARLQRAVAQARASGAACFWCGFGYETFNMKAQHEHLAICPDAPEEARQHSRQELLDNRYDASGDLPEGWVELK